MLINPKQRGLFRRTISALFVLIILVAIIHPIPPAVAQSPTRWFFVADDGSYSALLPAGWVAEASQENGIRIANSQIALESDDSLAEDQFVLLLFQVTFGQLETLGLTPDTPLTDVVDSYAAQLTSDAPEIAFQPAVSAELGQIGVPRLAATAEGGSREENMTLITLEIFPGVIGVAALIAHIGEMGTYHKTALEALLSIRYSPPFDATFQPEGSSFIFDHPAGWIARNDQTAGFSVVTLVNNAEGLSLTELVPGEIQWMIADLTAFQDDVAALGLAPALREIAAGFIAGDAVSALSEPYAIQVGDVEVALINLVSDFGNGGGVLVSTGQGVYIVIYTGLSLEGILAQQVAINIALSGRPPVDLLEEDEQAQ